MYREIRGQADPRANLFRRIGEWWCRARVQLIPDNAFHERANIPVNPPLGALIIPRFLSKTEASEGEGVRSATSTIGLSSLDRKRKREHENDEKGKTAKERKRKKRRRLSRGPTRYRRERFTSRLHLNGRIFERLRSYAQSGGEYPPPPPRRATLGRLSLSPSLSLDEDSGVVNSRTP